MQDICREMNDVLLILSWETYTPTNSDMNFLEFDIRLKDVTFSYDNKPVLQGVSVEVEQGSTVAIVGRSGSGKSTLLKLLTGLFEAQGGKITIGSHDIQDIKVSGKNPTRVASQVCT